METYKLTKTQKGAKFQYTVTDSQGNQISTRTSTRDYVACTIDGSFYFGRLDLIGKGDHGRILSRAHEVLDNPEKAYDNEVPTRLRKEVTFEIWAEKRQAWASKTIESNNTIAYI